MSVRQIAERLKHHEPRVLPRTPSTRTAAVAAILRAGPEGPDGSSSADETEVLFIRRAESPRDPWSGQMAFPGGRYEPTDVDLLATAVRETNEEIGLDLAKVAVPLGQLDEIQAHVRGKLSELVVRPYVFELRPGSDIVAAKNYEVAEVLWGKLGPLVRGEADTTLHYQGEGFDRMMPAFDVAGRTVWGLTYQMLRTLFERLR